MTPSELILVRHGETQWNSEKKIQGQLDSPLTERGESEAFAVGYRLAGTAFDFMFSSDLGRAVQTAEIIDGVVDTGFELNEGLRELDFGIFQDMRWDEAVQKYPDEARQFRSADTTYQIPGGESLALFSERCVKTLYRIEEEHRGARTLVVCHGGVIGMLVRHVLRIPMSAPRRYEIANASYNRFVVSDGVWMAHTLGDTEHLTNTPYDEVHC